MCSHYIFSFATVSGASPDDFEEVVILCCAIKPLVSWHSERVTLSMDVSKMSITYFPYARWERHVGSDAVVKAIYPVIDWARLSDTLMQVNNVHTNSPIYQ
jgi:hypothetical protein